MDVKVPRSIPIAFKHALILDETDFGALVFDGKLYLPYDLEPLCHTLEVKNSALLVALIRTDPRTVASALGWETAKVPTALGGLKKVLLPYHGDDSVSTIPPPAHLRPPRHR